MLRTIPTLVVAAILGASLLAQAPMGQVHAGTLAPLNQVPDEAVAPLNRRAIAVTDAINDAAGLPCRYAIPTSAQITPATHGQWEALDAQRDIWRLRVRAPGASHINLGFGSFAMPQGAQLQIYSADYSYVVRPFDSDDNRVTQELWTPVVLGEEIVVELCVPRQVRGQELLTLTSINSGYRFFGAGPSAVAAPEGGSCNVDVACPQGVAWAQEIPSVAAISTGGSVFCTGVMVNNTAQDGTPFFLTAYHCGIRSNNAGSLVAYWNYENTTCNGGGANFNQFTSGSTLRAGYSNSDFTLVQFFSAPNPAWGVTYSGWDATGANASSAVGIHHPSGCEKKISFENQATTTTNYLSNNVSGSGTHYRVIDWDTGTTEPGSSGSPLYNQNHQIIGQLHGGSAACGNDLSDWYGRISVSWNGGGSSSSRLRDWLDPGNTGALTLNTLGGVQPGIFTVYGQGCPGSVISSGTCGQVNPSGGSLANITRSNEYAYAVSNSGTVQVTGFDIFTGSTGGNATVGAYLYTEAGGGPGTSPVASTTITIGSQPAFYTATFAAPVTVNGNYYIALDHSAQTTYLSELNSGASGIGYWRRPPLSGSWAQSSLINAPSFRVTCAPANLVPQIGNTGVPRVNQSFAITLDQAAPSRLAFLFLGYSDTTWTSGALPWPIPNAPGCNVLMSADLARSAFTSGTGTSSLNFTVPNLTTLVGAQFYHQWFVSDPGANALGAAVSAGAASTVGG